jgi:hypothetical protein
MTDLVRVVEILSGDASRAETVVERRGGVVIAIRQPRYRPAVGHRHALAGRRDGVA